MRVVNSIKDMFMLNFVVHIMLHTLLLICENKCVFEEIYERHVLVLYHLKLFELN